MSYSLTAHSPYEGYKMAINGSGAKLEVDEYHKRSFDAYTGATSNNLRVYNRNGDEIYIKVPRLSGSHGGSDDIMLKILLKDNYPDRYKICSRFKSWSNVTYYWCGS